jgi:hypothetical protein
MSSASYFITPQQRWSRIGSADAPMILDCCRRASYDAADERHNWLAKTTEKAA